MVEPTKGEIERFREDGFLVVERFIDPDLARAVADRFPRIFRGEFETTVPPDEWRWVEGRDPPHVTRMIWNGWKSDRTIAALALSENIGRMCARLASWSGTRLSQDGCLWKPPGATGLAFHQDGNYNAWFEPSELVTCWIPLDEIDAGSGGIEYARGSHRWGAGQRPNDFHAPANHRAPVEKAAAERDRTLEIARVSVPVGGCVFHGTWVWHGSGPNAGPRDRRVLSLHCMAESARFHPTRPAYAQGRFRRFQDTSMDESFYPITWGQERTRSSFINDYLEGERRGYRTHTWSRRESGDTP